MSKLNIAEIEYIKNHKDMSEVEIAELLNTTVTIVKKFRKQIAIDNSKDDGEFHPKNTNNPGFGTHGGATVGTDGAAQKMDDWRGGGYNKKNKGEK